MDEREREPLHVANGKRQTWKMAGNGVCRKRDAEALY